MWPGPPPRWPPWIRSEEWLDRCHLFHATRATLLRALGRNEEAREADLVAIGLTANPVERALLQERIGFHWDQVTKPGGTTSC